MQKYQTTPISLYTTMDNVKLALSAMYSPSAGQDEKKAAMVFLESFQKSPDAWQIAHQVLSDSSQPLEYRMFASQTLRSKATFDLQQLLPDSLAQLKLSLLELLTIYASKDKLIRTQLSLALCQVALQYLAWENPMGDITGALSAPDMLPALLEFLKILPEELTELNKTPLTDEQFSARSQLLIEDNVGHVLLLLQTLSEQGSASLLLLDCLNSWIKECPIEKVLAIGSLAELIFRSITTEDLFEQASDCLCSVLRETRDIDNYTLIDALYKQLLQVHEFYLQNPDRLDDSTVGSLTKLYVEAGESWTVLIAKNPDHFKPLVSIVLECTKYKEDLDVVKYTFYFWYQLKQMIVLPRYDAAKRILRDIFWELITVMISHLRYPDGDDANLFGGDKEQEDKFREFRYDIGDVLKDCCIVVGAQDALNVPFGQIQTFLGQNSWQDLEAPLFCLRVMAQEIPSKENTVLPVLMELLVQLPEHPRIRYATTLVLGRYSVWTSKHPQFLDAQLNYIIKGLESLTDQDTVRATSQALMYFCQDCALFLVNYADQLFVVYQQVHLHLHVTATYDLVNGLAHVIKQIDVSNQAKALQTFLAPTMQRLTQLSQQLLDDDTVTTALHDEAEVLSIFFHILRCVNYDQAQYPVATFFMELVYPLVEQILQKFGLSLKVSEHFVKTIKNVVQGCSVYVTPLLPRVTSLLHENFRQYYFGCYLWATGVIIREFSDENSSELTHQAVYEFGLSQSLLFFQLLERSTDIRSIPDVIEDFFSMASDLLMFFPLKATSNSSLVSSILTAGVLALSTSEEHNPLMACLHFFIDYVSWGLEYPPVSFYEDDPKEVRNYVQQFLAADTNGQKLVTAVVNGLIFKFYNDPEGNELLLKIMTVADCNQALGWLNNAVSGLDHVSELEIQKLMQVATVALSNKDNRRVRIAIKDFVSWYTRRNVNSRAFA